MPQIPPITGVAEVVLNVCDLPQMRQFYCHVLGFAVHSELCLEQEDLVDPQGDPTITFLTICPLETPLGRTHPQMLVLIDHRRHVWARPRFPGHDVRQSTLNHLAFEIPADCYNSHLARLRQLELNPQEMSFPDLQAKAIFFCDPEGNQLELITRDV